MEDEGFSDELAGAGDFSRIAEEAAWKNGCAGCPRRNLYGAHGMCLEAYSELLQNFSMGKSGGVRCPLRKE